MGLPFLSCNYGDGSLADTNNNNLGNTPAEIQRNQKLVNNNNQDYARIDKSKGEDLCSGTNFACVWIVSTVTNGLTILILHHPNLIITIIAVRVFLVDNCYNCI
jgi:hypothetical protein